jgi:hypothetical protein
VRDGRVRRVRALDEKVPGGDAERRVEVEAVGGGEVLKVHEGVGEHRLAVITIHQHDGLPVEGFARSVCHRAYQWRRGMDRRAAGRPTDASAGID